MTGILATLFWNRRSNGRNHSCHLISDNDRIIKQTLYNIWLNICEMKESSIKSLEHRLYQIYSIRKERIIFCWGERSENSLNEPLENLMCLHESGARSLSCNIPFKVVNISCLSFNSSFSLRDFLKLYFLSINIFLFTFYFFISSFLSFLISHIFPIVKPYYYQAAQCTLD